MQKLKQLLFKKISLLLGIASLLLVLSVSACSSTASTALPSEFRIGYQEIPNAELLAKSLDLAEARFPDIRIKWVPFSSGRDVLLAIANDKIDVGLAGSVPAAAAIAQNLPAQVYYIHNIIGDNEALAVTQASKINAVRDLTGKRIAVPFGSTTHFSLLASLSNANIPASSLEILDMQPNEILSAWKQGTINGGFIWQPVLGQLAQDKGKVLLTARELSEQGVVTADLGVVNQEFAADYPNFLSSYVNVLNEAVQIYRDEPERAAAAIAPEISLTPQQSLAVMNQIIWLDIAEQTSQTYLGTPTNPGELSQVLKASADFMVEQNAIPPAPPLETFQAGLFNQAIEQALQQKENI